MFALIKTYKRSIIVIGISNFSVCAIVFQILQSWCDTGIETSLLRWIFPFLTAILSFGFILSVYSIFLLNKKCYVENSTPEMLAHYILKYAEQLKAENRDFALVDFRNKLTYILHILGSHEIRVKLGEMALGSATIIHDQESKIEILIDDLGWCNYLLNNRETSINYIKKGINLANQYLKNTPTNLRVSLAKAKGLRHLAILEAQGDFQYSQQNLEEALKILEELDGDLHQVKTDIAQIYHAKASIILISLGIDNSNIKIRHEDTAGREKVQKAIEDIEYASSQFEQIGEIDRYVKSLFLHYSLLDSIDDKEGCTEIAVIRDRALLSSQWVTNKGIEGIIK